ncbi:MAG: HAD family hydrolase [Bacteroidia bacterium]|nr:HAD family hydrolase [Bacteroidia bacterium]
MSKAIFFDRDGVLNREIGDYVCHIDDFEVLQDSVECVKLAKDKGFKVIVVTNQGGIDKELYSVDELKTFHDKLQDACRNGSTLIDDFYFCPHHPIKGKCLCRKPDSLMIEKAIAKYQLNPALCLIIGDTERDIEAGQKAGISTLLIQPNTEKKRLLEEAIEKLILSEKKS